MKKQDTINELAEAIYAIRPSEGATFDAGFALDQVAGHGLQLGMHCLTQQATNLDPSLVAWCDKANLDRLATHAMSETQAIRFATAFAFATRAHEPFVDLLALASSRLKRRYGVALPDLFVCREDRNRVKREAIQYQRTKKNVSPLLGFMEHFAGSLALAALAGLHQDPAKLTQSKVKLILGCNDDRSLRVAGMQVFLALTHFPHYIGSVKLALVSNREVSVAFVLGRKACYLKAA